MRLMTILALCAAIALPSSAKVKSSKKTARTKAQTEQTTKTATVAKSNEPTEAEKEAARESADWYIPLNYGGFDFEIPAGSLVEKNSKVIVKYPDGTFGVSMENEEFRGGNQKIAFEKARSYANKYKLTNATVEKVKVSGVAGAKATGMLESHKVTVLILPVNDQQLTTVIMATPKREEWARHFIDSMKN